ncbi:MAG: hypothetical protein IRY95_09415 [Clostridia bacterium]|nr:hypothetical protein [Clostridia bacterium]
MAVLDTSFWTAAVHVGVDAYLPLFFAMPILVPSAVRAEIEREGSESRRLREDQQRFRLWLEDGRLAVADPAKPHSLLGRGEAACLGLAQERRLVLLVNERRGYVEAKRLGIRAVTVPEIVVRLAKGERISVNKARSMLDVLEETTADAIIALARSQLDRLDDGGGLR